METADWGRGGPIILFDGTCGVCSRWVRFVLRHDRRGAFRFAALQSATGTRLLRAHGLPGGDLSSVVLVHRDGVFRQSTAVLRILRGLGGVWAVAYAAIILPAPVRDRLYALVARYRHRWFAASDACVLPGPAERGRFVQGRRRLGD